ncbi:MAG: hypothetical protein WEB60_02630 [Terrimicrobiaceae bacterium]
MEYQAEEYPAFKNVSAIRWWDFPSLKRLRASAKASRFRGSMPWEKGLSRVLQDNIQILLSKKNPCVVFILRAVPAGDVEGV